MKVTSERVGQTIVLELGDDRREITVILDIDVAAKLGTTLVAQTTMASDGLEIPAELRPTDRET